MAETEIILVPEIKLPASVEPSKWECEERAFRRLLPSLLKTHRGQHVAIHNVQVVGNGPDQLELARESYRRFGYVPVYVGLVTDNPTRPVRVVSPRFLR